MIANARMYSVTPEAAEAWRALFRHLSATVPLEIVEHPFPLPVSELWRRDDLLCAFMCGWPWVRDGARHLPVAAPVPVDAGGPFYWTDLAVPARHPARSLADTNGGRVGFTLLDSQSGFSAIRQHLRFLGTAAPRFAAVVGPLTTPRRVMEALAEDRIDLGPLDSYAHALLRRHFPQLASEMRVIARTRATPVPILVASPTADPPLVARLRAALLDVHDPAILEPLCLEGFAEPLPLDAYMAMEWEARAAEAAGINDMRAFLRDPIAA